LLLFFHDDGLSYKIDDLLKKEKQVLENLNLHKARKRLTPFIEVTMVF
jgi:hypothetical protein